MIIDFHTHIFPDKMAERTIAVLEENASKRGNFRAAIPATLDALLASMEKNGIDCSVVLPIATNTRQSTTINAFAQTVNNTRGVFSFGSLHPMQEDWESVLYDIKEKGLRGIKLHPEYQQFYIDSPESIRILQKCEELDLITVLHAGNDVGTDPPVHCMPKRLKNALEYVKGDKIIAGHFGGWRAWDEVESCLVGTPVYFDTAYTVDHIDSEQFLRIIKTHGSKKIVYASDSPWESQGHAAEVIGSMPLTKDEKDDIFYRNAKKLLKIY